MHRQWPLQNADAVHTAKLIKMLVVLRENYQLHESFEAKYFNQKHQGSIQ